MDDLTKEAHDALLRAITARTSEPHTAAVLRDLAEAYQRVTGAPDPTSPPTPISAIN